MRIVALGMSFIFLVALVPTNVGAEYIGMQLGRPTVNNFTLTDQNGNDFDFYSLNGDAIIVSFIFTRCPDVCPIITQKLSTVEANLPLTAKAKMVSITVDPNYDTPERMKAYMEKHSVSWPHLGGTYEEVKPIWDAFIINAFEQNFTETNSEVLEDNTFDTDYENSNNSSQVVTIFNGTNNTKEFIFDASAYQLLQLAAHNKNWTLNVSKSQYGNYMDGINGINRTNDYSFSWGFYLWNKTSLAWEESMFGIDGRLWNWDWKIAFAPYGGNISEIPTPTTGHASVTLLYPNGSNDSAVLYNNSTYGYLSNTIKSMSNNATWHWESHAWNKTNEIWVDTTHSIAPMTDEFFVAWAPNSTNNSQIPRPSATICDGHGWIMGAGENMHCMCDSNYSWPKNDMLSCEKTSTEGEPNYNVAHNTITYILDSNFKPIVAWAGSDWNPSDVVQDIMKVIDFSLSHSASPDEGLLSGFVFTTMLSSIGMATIITRKNNVKHFDQ